MNNYMIYGKNANESRGGAFFGILEDTGLPAFGGGNLIHAAIWWNSTEETVQAICDKLMNEYECNCYPKKVG